MNSIQIMYHSAGIQLTWILIPIIFVNTGWDSTVCQLSWHEARLRIDSVDVSLIWIHSVTWSLTQHWLSWRGVTLYNDSVCEDEQSQYRHT